MMQKEQVLIFDAGNTRIKTALFTNGVLEKIERFTLDQSQDFQNLVANLHFPPIFVSSVLSDYDLAKFLGETPHVQFFHWKMNLPVQIAYENPETLGLDRLANACAIQAKQMSGAKVAIDMGTCIKFDFVDEEGVYHGGSISPGAKMRFAALHHFTGKLPHLESVEKADFIGKNSKKSILSGVMDGIQGELNHFISRYMQDYQGLTFFVTGGDAKFFEFPAKNNIFADENLTLTGLYKIYLLNA